MKSILFAVIGLLLLLIEPGFGQSLDRAGLGVMLMVVALLLLLHLMFNREKNWARIDTLFIISYCVVNFQWPVLILIKKSYPAEWRFSSLADQQMMYATWLGVVFLAVWLAGYWLPIGKTVSVMSPLRNRKILKYTTVVIFLVFVFMSGKDYVSGKLYKESVEGVGIHGTVQGVAAYIYTIFQILVLVLVAWYVYGLKLRIISGRSSWVKCLLGSKESLTTLLLLCVMCVYFLIAGERGQVIQICCAIGLAVGAAIRPVKLKSFVVALVAGAVLMTFVRYWRAGVDQTSMMLQNSHEIGAFEYSDSLAKSLYSTYVGMLLANDSIGYYWGTLWISNILGVIPFAQKIFISISGLSIQDISGPAAITTYVYGNDPMSGLGTTLVADLYMNLGKYFSIPVMMAYGWICQLFHNYIKGENGLLRFVMAVAFGSLIIYMPRAGLFTQLQPVIWGSVIALIFMRIKLNQPG
ncbi:MAG: hypothetical protein H3C34_03635 [Caldilineaceae bacterium]|nr:hypothetical protein [Caldilineaceae bacterium]